MKKHFRHFVLLLAFASLFSCLPEVEQKLIPLDYIGKITPKNSSEISSSPFGIQAGTMEDSLLVKAAQIGVKWTRLLAGWEGIEKEKGVFNWEKTDEAIDAVIKYGITPFVTINPFNPELTLISTTTSYRLLPLLNSTF